MNAPKKAAEASTDFPILVVDDERQVYELLNQLAQHEFPQSSFVYKATYTEAIDYLSQLRGWLPRLILLDIDLKQDKSGLDILDWIRANDNYTLVPVVMLSVIQDEAIVRDAYARGANTFTGKPFELSEWRAYIQYLRDYWFEMASIPKIWVSELTSSQVGNS